MTFDAIVVGGGISGLACLWRLVRAGVNAIGLEASGRAGGVIRSCTVDGFLVEAGPTTVQATASLLELVRELGLDAELVRVDRHGTRYLFLDGRLEPVPLSPSAFAMSGVLSWRGRLRLLAEPWAAAATSEEESVRDFFVRRFGPEVHDVLVAPLVSGTFAGDPARMSLAAVFPSLAALERRYGSVLWGALRGGFGDRTAPRELVSFVGGQQRLPERLAERLGERLRLGARVSSIAAEKSFRLSVARAGAVLDARAVVLATPPEAAASLVPPECAATRAELESFDAPPLVCLNVAYPREAVAHPLDGFGFLAPRGRGVRILGCLWTSSLFRGRAPQDWVALSVFVGGATDPEAAALVDAELLALVARDLGVAVGATGAPRLLSLERYARAIPQYGLGHHGRVVRMRTGLPPGLFLTGSYLEGIAVGDCIAQAGDTASEVITFLR